MSNATVKSIRKSVVDKLEKNGDIVTSLEIRDGKGSGRFISKESNKSVDFLFKTSCQRFQYEVPSNWDSSYIISDDGEVFSEDDRFIGWIKIISNHPTKCKRNYNPDEITIEIPQSGNIKYTLNDRTADAVIQDLKSASDLS